MLLFVFFIWVIIKKENRKGDTESTNVVSETRIHFRREYKTVCFGVIRHFYLNWMILFFCLSPVVFQFFICVIKFVRCDEVMIKNNHNNIFLKILWFWIRIYNPLKSPRDRIQLETFSDIQGFSLIFHSYSYCKYHVRMTFTLSICGVFTDSCLWFTVWYLVFFSVFGNMMAIFNYLLTSLR